MSTLKELTKENHRLAERSAFVGAMMRNQLTPAQWTKYLVWKRDILLFLDAKLRLSAKHPEFDRTGQFEKDIIDTNDSANAELKATAAYIDHIDQNIKDAWAHVYVHYLGDLRGGQMLKKMVKLPMSHVEYTDAEGLEAIIREHVTDDLAAEANKGFELTMQAMQEIMS